MLLIWQGFAPAHDPLNDSKIQAIVKRQNVTNNQSS